MNGQYRAYRALVNIHGKTLVHEYLPLVAKRGFIVISEIQKQGVDPETHGWVPQFHHTESPLWVSASGYTPQVPERVCSNPGVFLAQLLSAALQGGQYWNHETKKWESSAEVFLKNNDYTKKI